MNEIFQILIFFSIGIITGTASGLLGIGGGIIFVPALYFMLPQLHVSPGSLSYAAIATSLFAGSFSSSGAFLNHFHSKNVRIKEALLLGLGSVISALIVPMFVVKIDPAILKYIFSAILLLVAANMLMNKTPETDSKINLKLYYLILFGLFVGAVSAISGLGGGILFVPILVYLFAFDIKLAIGTSTLVVALTMISSAISFAMIDSSGFVGEYHIGYINLFAGVLLGLGAVIGSRIGLKMMFKFSTLSVKRIFSLFLIVAIIKMIFD